MRRKYGKTRQNAFVGVLRIVLFVILSLGAIRIGVAAGNGLSDTNINIVRNIHVESFKSTLNKSIPLIDTVYNSGNMSISFSGEVHSFIKKIFEFDLDNPVTILNAQSPFLYSFYNNEYQDYLAMKEQEEQKKRTEENNADNTSGNDNDTGNDNTDSSNPDDKIADGTPPDENTTQYESSQSSWEWEGNDAAENKDENERDRSDKNIVSSGKIIINNQSNKKIDDALINKLLKEPLKIKFDKKGPQILIYHTHTTESYLKRVEDLNKKGIQSRTEDTRYSVVRPGEELAQYLRKRYNFNVMHNGTINDYDFNEAYNTARGTVTKILKGNPSLKVLIDVHRDAANGEMLRRVTKVNGKNTAQIMFVLGINHDNWRENFKLALKLQERLNAQYPGLALPIILRGDVKFNQHISYGAFIVEVGGDGNTVQEAAASTEYLAKALNDVLGGLK